MPGGFSGHLCGARFPLWIIGRNSMTPWEARIVGADWAPKWSPWCATMRSPEATAERYPAIPLEGWGPHTRPRPTTIRGAGPGHPWDAEAGVWFCTAPEPHTGWRGDLFSPLRKPIPPRLVLHAGNILQATQIRGWERDAATIRWLPPEEGGHPAHGGALPKGGGAVRQCPVPPGRPPRALPPHALLQPCCRATPRAGPPSGSQSLLGGSRRRCPAGPPPPEWFRWALMGRHLTPPRRAPYLYVSRHGAPLPRVGRTHRGLDDQGVHPTNTRETVREKTLGRDDRRCVRARHLELRDSLP